MAQPASLGTAPTRLSPEVLTSLSLCVVYFVSASDIDHHLATQRVKMNKSKDEGKV